MIVSNHGGRHFDGAPATIDILPAIVSAVGSRATVMIDSGIRGGLDIVRALALGAKFCFTGRLLRLWARRARASRRAARHRYVLRRDQDRVACMSAPARSRRPPASRCAIRARGGWAQLTVTRLRCHVAPSHAAADRGDHEADLLAQHRQRDRLQLLLEPEHDQPMHGGEQRARQQRAAHRATRRPAARAAILRHSRTGAAAARDTRRERPGQAASGDRTGRASAACWRPRNRDRRAPCAPAARSRRWPPAGSAGAVGGDQVALERGERARVHQQHEVVEILDHVVDCADRAADLFGQRRAPARPRPLLRDGLLGRRHQGVAQPSRRSVAVSLTF